VAPEVLGLPTPAQTVCDGSCVPPYADPPSTDTIPIVLPDTRLGLTTGAGAPLQFSLEMSVNGGAGYDAASNHLTPTLDSPQIDV